MKNPLAKKRLIKEFCLHQLWAALKGSDQNKSRLYKLYGLKNQRVSEPVSRKAKLQIKKRKRGDLLRGTNLENLHDAFQASSLQPTWTCA
jgi:hypothetical protein